MESPGGNKGMDRRSFLSGVLGGAVALGGQRALDVITETPSTKKEANSLEQSSGVVEQGPPDSRTFLEFIDRFNAEELTPYDPPVVFKELKRFENGDFELDILIGEDVHHISFRLVEGSPIVAYRWFKLKIHELLGSFGPE